MIREAPQPQVLPSALHTLRATPKTVHWGYFDASLAPVLTVRSGDLVQAEAITPHAGDDPDLILDPAAADFGVTQVVDGRQGIHVRIPRGIFPPPLEPHPVAPHEYRPSSA